MIICLGFWIVFVLSRISLYQVYIGFCTIQFYCNIKLAGLENTVRSRIQSSFCKVSLNQGSTVLISIILHTSHYPASGRREKTQSRIQEKTPKNVKSNSLRSFSWRIRTHSLRALSCQTASQFKIVKSQSINIFFVIIIKSTCSDTETEGARDYLL